MLALYLEIILRYIPFLGVKVIPNTLSRGTYVKNIASTLNYTPSGSTHKEGRVYRDGSMTAAVISTHAI